MAARPLVVKVVCGKSSMHGKAGDALRLKLDQPRVGPRGKPRAGQLSDSAVVLMALTALAVLVEVNIRRALGTCVDPITGLCQRPSSGQG